MPKLGKPSKLLWRAVESRDRAADGQFVYAVRSTGVYCRPSCPSRRPRREQVVFFPFPDAAEGHGFRPCLRCRPQMSGSPDSRTRAVVRVCREIDARLRAGNGEPAASGLTIAALSAFAGMSADQLDRAFRSIMTITP